LLPVFPVNLAQKEASTEVDSIVRILDIGVKASLNNGPEDWIAILIKQSHPWISFHSKPLSDCREIVTSHLPISILVKFRE
jgi:hypothetical protein